MKGDFCYSVNRARAAAVDNIKELSLAGGRLIWPQRTRMTRNFMKGLLPPQKSSGTLLAAMATVWNGLPEAIKSEKSENKIQEKN
jgi:hypothetical protein